MCYVYHAILHALPRSNRGVLQVIDVAAVVEAFRVTGDSATRNAALALLGQLAAAVPHHTLQHILQACSHCCTNLLVLP